MLVTLHFNNIGDNGFGNAINLGPCQTRNKVDQRYQATLLLNKVA